MTKMGQQDGSAAVAVWVTDAARKMAAEAPVSSTAAPAARIQLNPRQRFQEILGFGAALTDGAGFTLSRLAESKRGEILRELFDPAGMGLNVCRTAIGASDSSRKAASYDDGIVDPDLERFSIEEDRAYVLPLLREARRLNPDLFLFSSPWSPPGWMKSGGTLLGGCMRHTYMPSYANYFLKYLSAYEDEGVEIQAVTVQNEIDSDHDGAMPACGWPQDYEADFVTMHLGPLFARSEQKTKIWMIDHGYDLWGRAICALETEDVRKYSRAIAWHGGKGSPEWMSRVQRAFPDVEMHWTDGGPELGSTEYETDWAQWGREFSEILRNGCQSLTTSTLASDEHGRPWCGTTQNGGRVGLLTVHSESAEVRWSGMYHALGHYARFVQRGARRIASEGGAEALAHCAFENPDGGIVTVVVNTGAACTCGVETAGKAVVIALPADSVVTVALPRHTA